MSFQEDDYLLISEIQHFRFCQRQWALIHVEDQWADNVRTVEGNALHRKAHDAAARERRGDLLIVRSLRVASPRLGIVGACDVVEFRRDTNGVPLHGEEGLYLPFPIEYKRGTARTDGADELQLCAQAIKAKWESRPTRGGWIEINRRGMLSYSISIIVAFYAKSSIIVIEKFYLRISCFT